MVKLLIIADDFTGALDTGVLFAEKGAYTEVLNDINYDLSRIKERVEVLVMNAETRHCSADEAYQRITAIGKRALGYGIAHIYKKTDSALRGNIAGELTALLHVSGLNMLPFVPAFPKMNRITVNGIHYIDGVPVHQSVFGQDPFEPVTVSDIQKLINTQMDTPVQVVTRSNHPEKLLPDDKSKIYVFDAVTDEDMRKIAEGLKKKGNLRIMAGCAGFAEVLPEVLSLGGHETIRPEINNNFLIVCGSVNPITKEQIAYACENGFKRITLKPHQKLDKSYYSTDEGRAFMMQLKQSCLAEKRLIMDTNDSMDTDDSKESGNAADTYTTLEYAKEKNLSLEDVRLAISGTFGFIIKALIDEGLDSTMLITGGDTLLGFMNQFEDCKIVPVCQMETGVVLSEIDLNGDSFKILSKSGGFGKRELFVTLAENIVAKNMTKE